MKKTVLKLVCTTGLLLAGLTVSAQETVDSLRENVARYAARNFSESRTFNLYWEVSPTHDYTLERNGQEIESGKMKMLRTVKFQMLLPVFRTRKFSVYADGEFNTNHFETDGTQGANSIFTQGNNGNDNHIYYKAGVRANYYMRVAGKNLLLSAFAAADGLEKKFGTMQGSIMALMSLKQSAANRVSVGVYVMVPFQITPVVPIITWTHQFDAHWLVDLTLPSRTYIRYQNGNHRFSAGMSMENEHFYLKPGLEGLPEVCYYSKSLIRPEMVYECILNKHFYLIARAGGIGVIDGGLYNKDRKGIDGDPFVKISHPMTPFFNVGFSYNIFK